MYHRICWESFSGSFLLTNFVDFFAVVGVDFVAEPNFYVTIIYNTYCNIILLGVFHRVVFHLNYSCSYFECFAG